MVGASVIVAVVVGLAFTALVVATDWLQTASGARARADLLIADINGSEKLLIDVETGERGFVITSRDTFLEPVLSARRKLPGALTMLVRETRSEPREHALAIAIQRGTVDYLEHWNDRVISLARRSLPRARTLVATAGGKQRIDALRTRFSALATAANERAVSRTQQAQEAADQASLLAILVLIGAIVLMVIYAAYLARAISLPVRRVAAAADRLAGGELSARVPSRGGAELHQLALAFNEMGDSLQRASHDLEARNAQLEQARAEAHAARERAERADQAKNDYLSRMSHELRTPLNAIIGFGQLLEMDDLSASQQEEVTHIVRAGRHLLELINEILDISRIEAGNLTISTEPVMLADIVADVLSLVRPLAEEREVKLRSDLGRLEHGAVLADKQRLKQVLLNLLSNAIKYNRRGGAATVSLQEAQPHHVRILVTDEGHGIAQDRIDRLFVPFDRLGAEAGEVQGTGLGLALSRRLTELMSGTLSVDTEVGRGSTFAVELPAAESPHDGPPSPPAAEEDPPAARARLDSAAIVYIEDNASNLRLVEQALAKQSDVRLIPAMHGALGLELARRHRPNLILLDLHLADMPGEEVLQHLRADPATREIPVIILSADATNRQIARLLDNGARDYLTKPLDLQRFRELVQAALRQPSRAAEAGRADR
jgi:signal transduction histidine kinase/ActR/RegA family two-component response regulator